MQKTIILNAQNLGFFRVKDAEKQSMILAELLELEELAEFEESDITVRHVLLIRLSLMQQSP